MTDDATTPVPPGGNRQPREPGERGPFDSLFEKGHVPMDEPPGFEEREYRRWKAAGGQVIYTPSAVEGKYGVITARRKAFHPGEPVFIIRATDRNAVAAVIDYASACANDGCDALHVKAAVDHAYRIREWQENNPTLVKKPD
jgi:hypothetical protein